MTEDLRNAAPSPAASGATAGSLLRAAREAQGLHVAALAIQLKVPPRKLEALEADRYDELLDPTFTRALALAVCRLLKIDAAPVLALLPKRPLDDLEHVASGGINTAYKDHGGPPPEVRLPIGKGALTALGVIVLAVLALVLAPADFGSQQLEQWLQAASAPASASAPPEVVPPPDAASVPALEPASAVTVVAAMPAASQAASAATTEAAAGPLVLTAVQASWVQVLDADARPLLIRQLAAGESVNLDNAPPLRLIIGNAAGTRVTWRGQAVDLAARTRDNVARFELTGTTP
ncbi:MAG: helix-turn-helix domain-containing protein [Proteobacteria bacterium]|nr:helix-turn-helix domain-containing protein [Pseudomonadota bacterium]